ncbi:amino acid ABC transporter permease [Leucobacter sp. OH2974_COT-288]|nr:amino acid ABC transporter permease [Leucobacter sp. OH2974_COT-288]
MKNTVAGYTACTVSEVELERRKYRRKAARRSLLLSVLSTLVVAFVLVFAMLNSPGWERVRDNFFDIPTALNALPKILEGLWLNVRVLAVAVVGVTVLGALLAIIRTVRNPLFTPLKIMAAAYVDFMRGIPVLLMLYLVGYGIPGLQLFNRMPPAFWGTIAIVLCYSAYVAEVLRSGIEAVHPSQRIAARALGLSYPQTLRLVVLPQAVRKVTPALMNDFVSLQKDVGLISVLGAVDAVRAAQIEVAQVYNFTPYLVAGLIFVLLSLPFVRLTEWLNKRAQQREQIGGVV